MARSRQELGTHILTGYFQIDILNVINPPSTTPSSSFEFESRDDEGNLLDFKREDIALTATSEALTSVVLESVDQTVAAVTELEVSVILNNPLLAGGYIQMGHPDSPYLGVSMIGEDYTVTAMAGLDDDLTSTYADNVLTVNDAVPNQIDGGTTISFRVSDFLNPISTAELTGFWLATFDAEGGTIDDS